MESKLARHAEQQLIESARKLSPAERPAAFVEHCRLVQELYRSAGQSRESSRVQGPRDVS
jgi:hypothetical protein